MTTKHQPLLTKKQQEEQERTKRQYDNWREVADRRRAIMSRALDLHFDIQNLMKVEAQDPVLGEAGRVARLELRKDLRPDYHNKVSGFLFSNEGAAVESMFVFDKEAEREQEENRRRRVLASKK
jgi:hypothetical protein